MGGGSKAQRLVEPVGGASRRLDASLRNTRYQGEDDASNNQWYVAAQLDPPPSLTGAFGSCVSVSGDVVVAGGRAGAVRYVKSNHEWARERTWLRIGEAQDTSVDGNVTAIALSEETIVAANNESDVHLRGGVSVSVSGMSVAIATESGEVYVDDRVAAHRAVALALDGDFLLIGGIGSARLLWRRDNWVQIATLVGEEQSSDFGRAVALNAGLAVVAGSDAAYVFAEDAQWSRVARFELNAISVAVTTGLVAVGSSGETYVYAGTASDWEMTGKISLSDPDSLFGYAVAADSDTIVIGAPGRDTVYILAENSGDNTPEQPNNMISHVIAYVVFPTLVLFVLFAIVRAVEACGQRLREHQLDAEPPLALTRTIPADDGAVPTARVTSIELTSTTRAGALPAATLVQVAVPAS